jgi:MoaA/NifB/PqqE/SkfB family radical SAM enzyme
MSFTHTVARALVGKAADGVLKNISTNRDEGLLKLLDTAERVAGKMFQPKTYESGREVIRDHTNKWNIYLNKFLDEANPNVIKTAFMNLAFESAWYGTKQIRKNREIYHCNIPWTILIDPTSACNMHCKGCWAAEYGHKLNLTREQLDSIVTQGKKLGTYFYMFTGGEPLVRKNDILWLAEKHHDCEFNIFSNATLIDEEFCERVAELGNIVFSVSLEGFREVNDSRRGEGDFDKVISAMQLMKKHGLLFGTSICYTRPNCETVTSDEFLDLLIENGCRYSWYFHYMPVGAGSDVDLLPTPEQREYMIHRIREIRGRQGGKPLFVMDFQNDGEFVGGCIAGGRNYCHINANGDVEPCVFIHYSTANIKQFSLLESLQQPLFMAYHNGQPFNRNHLRPCPMLENPEYLKQMVAASGAVSTDLQAPESAEALCKKTAPYAASWAPYADRIWRAMPQHHAQYYENYKGVNHNPGENEDFKTAIKTASYTRIVVKKDTEVKEPVEEQVR